MPSNDRARSHTEPRRARRWVRAQWVALRGAGGAAAHWLHELTGEGAYRAYLQHQHRTHPEGTPLSEAEFWRQRYAEQDRNPGSRCC